MTLCPHCGQQLSRDCRCSFCPGIEQYSSPTKAVEKFFRLIGRSGAPALDPSRESVCGGTVGPVARWLHERARLAAVLREALGEYWESSEVFRALCATLGPSEGELLSQLSEREGATREIWDQIVRDALRKIRIVLERRGLLKPGGEGEIEVEREKIYHGWEEIAEYFEVSAKTLQRMIADDTNGKYGFEKAIHRRGERVVTARESDLFVCWERLYPKKLRG